MKKNTHIDYNQHLAKDLAIQKVLNKIRISDFATYPLY